MNFGQLIHNYENNTQYLIRNLEKHYKKLSSPCLFPYIFSLPLSLSWYKLFSHYRQTHSILLFTTDTQCSLSPQHTVSPLSRHMSLSLSLDTFLNFTDIHFSLSLQKHIQFCLPDTYFSLSSHNVVSLSLTPQKETFLAFPRYTLPTLSPQTHSSLSPDTHSPFSRSRDIFYTDYLYLTSKHTFSPLSLLPTHIGLSFTENHSLTS